MNIEMAVQAATVVLGAGAFAFGVIGITRSLQLQRVLMRKQERGLDAQQVKVDPEVRAALKSLRAPLIWAMILAVCSVVAPSVSRMLLA